MCEIRFSVSSKDGKLEGMLNAIPSGIRTEVVKEALRYFLSHVRDNKVESNYIDSDLLDSFRTNVKENLFSMEDMLRIIDSRVVQPAMTQYQSQPQPTVEQIQPLSNVSEIIKKEDEDEFDLDLSLNEFEGNDSGAINIDDINFDDVNF